MNHIIYFSNYLIDPLFILIVSGKNKNIFALSPNFQTKTEKHKRQKAPSTPNLTEDSSLLRNKGDATGSISPISPQEDLIQLESAKSSPLTSNQNLGHSSSSESLDQIQNDSGDSDYPLAVTSPPIIITSPLDETITSQNKNDLELKSELDDILGDDWNTPDDDNVIEEIIPRPLSPVPTLLCKQDERSKTPSPELPKQLSEEIGPKMIFPEPSQQFNNILSDSSPKKIIPKKTYESKSVSELRVQFDIGQNKILEDLQDSRCPKIDVPKSPDRASEQFKNPDVVVTVSLDEEQNKIPIEIKESVSMISAGDDKSGSVGLKLASSSKESPENCKPLSPSKPSVTFSDVSNQCFITSF